MAYKALSAKPKIFIMTSMRNSMNQIMISALVAIYMWWSLYSTVSKLFGSKALNCIWFVEASTCNFEAIWKGQRNMIELP